jgi:hypothetical protein
LTATLGVAILRRSASIVRLEQAGKSSSVTLHRTVSRNPGTPPAQVLRDLLSQVDAPRSAANLAVALSPADLACGDAWTLPKGMTGRTAAKVGRALCETRCASETLETLVVDASLTDAAAQAVALDRGLADDLLRAADGTRLVLLTAVPAALAQTLGAIALTQGGERFEVAVQDGVPSWRVSPVDRPDDAGSLAWNGLQVPVEQAAALAAAACDPERVPNLLHAFPQHRQTFIKRFRDALLNVAAAAALCLGALGVHFHRDAARERDELAAARRAEMELWGRFLPAEEPREGRLLKTMLDRLGDLGETGGAADVPSALAFWGEIGKQMPDPEALGLTLESLDLAPDGGRLSARVPAAKDDPLKNAAQLEGKLNQSKKMTTRGDYEVRDGQVQVRLRMDYKP